LILVDSSVWIDFFSSRPGPSGQELRRLIEDGATVAVTGVVVSEVLQGLKRDVERIENYLSLFELLEASGLQTYLRAAELFRLARSRVATLTTTDVIIATIAAENYAEIFSLDRDFLRIAKLSGIPLYDIV
jgi:predicted nucleic acid-binding protein